MPTAPLEGTHGKGAWVLQVPGRAVALIERARGTFGYVEADWHGGRDAPVPLDDLVAAAADPRLALPAKARAVPRNSTVAAVLHDHFANLVPASVLPSELGIGEIEAPAPFPWLRITDVHEVDDAPFRSREVHRGRVVRAVHLPSDAVGRDRSAARQQRLIDLVLDPRLQ